jgi:hypothetical protein
MCSRLVPLLIGMTSLAALSCGRPATPATGGAAMQPTLAKPAAEVSCGIESSRTVKLDDGTELRIWDLKLSGLKQLTAKLLIAVDGKVETANEIQFKWDAWGADAPAATGQLVLLVQDGKAFGAKDKKLPQMGLEIQGAPSQSMTGKKSGLFLNGDLQSRLATASQKQSLGKRSLIYAQLFVSKDKSDGNFSLTSDPEQLAAASKDGRTVLGVEVDWVGP